MRWNKFSVKQFMKMDCFYCQRDGIMLIYLIYSRKFNILFKKNIIGVIKYKLV
jgi:hypothetical protein